MAFACIVAGSTPATQAALFAKDIETTGSPWEVFQPGSYGTIFSVNDKTRVVRLGIWDEDGDGLRNAHEVGIFAPDRTLLACVTVPGGTLAPLEDGFRWVPLAGSLSLYPGINYTLASAYLGGADDRMRTTPATVDPLFNLVDDRFVNTGSYGIAFPDTDWLVDGAGWFAGNLVGIPEPSVLLLDGVVALAVGGGVWLHRHRRLTK